MHETGWELDYLSRTMLPAVSHPILPQQPKDAPPALVAEDGRRRVGARQPSTGGPPLSSP
ncbi:MAG: hypothetical protein ACK58M_27700 [Acidobacteriota bacterium]